MAALRVLVLAVVLLLPFLGVPAAAQTKKFCLTQFAIANQACAILPPTSPESHRRHHHHDDDEDEDNDDKHGDHDDEDTTAAITTAAMSAKSAPSAGARAAA
jgi:hypothetical protein